MNLGEQTSFAPPLFYSRFVSNAIFMTKPMTTLVAITPMCTHSNPHPILLKLKCFNEARTIIEVMTKPLLQLQCAMQSTPHLQPII